MISIILVLLALCNSDIFNSSVATSSNEKYDIFENIILDYHKKAFATKMVHFNKKMVAVFHF